MTGYTSGVDDMAGIDSLRSAVAGLVSNPKDSAVPLDRNDGRAGDDLKTMLLGVALKFFDQVTEGQIVRLVGAPVHIGHERQRGGRQQSHFRIDASQCGRN